MPGRLNGRRRCDLLGDAGGLGALPAGVVRPRSRFGLPAGDVGRDVGLGRIVPSPEFRVASEVCLVVPERREMAVTDTEVAQPVAPRIPTRLVVGSAADVDLAASLIGVEGEVVAFVVAVVSGVFGYLVRGPGSFSNDRLMNASTSSATSFADVGAVGRIVKQQSS